MPPGEARDGIYMAELFHNPLTWIATFTIATASFAGFVKAVLWFGKLHNGEKDFRKFVGEIKDEITDIRTHITEIFKRLPEPAATGASPLQLTEFGHKLSKKLKAEGWAAELAPKLSSKVAGKQPFQIDEYAENYVRKHLSDEIKNQVAVCAYEFGTPRDNVLTVLRVVLRDELLRIEP